jgi:uncharacterized membrane protein SirB2
MSWALLKQAHVGLAILTALGFVVRGYWMLMESPRLRARWVRIVPHVIDALLLASGITMAVGLAISPMARPWLAAKLVAVVIYIGLGTVALKRGRTYGQRVAALSASLLVLAYIVAVAITRNPLVLGG